jgi:hypothetical protein
MSEWWGERRGRGGVEKSRRREDEEREKRKSAREEEERERRGRAREKRKRRDETWLNVFSSSIMKCVVGSGNNVCMCASERGEGEREEMGGDCEEG